MIPRQEFNEKARALEIPLSTVERDYAQSWLLSNLPLMAFKGGTGIKKAYIENYRFSDDLDFTLLEKINIKKIVNDIKKSIIKTKEDSGINFLDEIKSEEVENGYVITVYFRILRNTGSPIKIKMDITKKNNEIIVLNTEKRKVIHKYSDNLEANIIAYKLEEIFSEKIRSLFQRTRPRDLYDVWYLKNDVKFDMSLFKKKCEFKKVNPDIKELTSRESNFKQSWEASLTHQLKELPKVEMVFNEVINYLKIKL